MLREEAAFAIPRAQSRPVGSQLQARPGRRLEPRQQSDRRAAPREAREFEKNRRERKRESARWPPNRPPTKGIPLRRPRTGARKWTPFLQSPRSKVRLKVKGRRWPLSLLFKLRLGGGAALVGPSSGPEGLRRPRSGSPKAVAGILRPLMGPNIGEGRGKRAE